MTQVIDAESIILIIGVNPEKTPDILVTLDEGTAIQTRGFRDPAELPDLLKMERHGKAEIICISSNLYGIEKKLIRASHSMAKAVAEHPNKPWVLLDDPGAAKLRPAFEKAGVQVIASAKERFENQRSQRLKTVLKRRSKVH